MTDPAPTPPTRRVLPRRPSPVPVYAGALALFVGVAGFLGAQVARGQDPSLGAGAQATAQAAPRNVVVKRVVVTERVVHVKPAPAAVPVTGSAPAAAAAASPAPAPAPAAQPDPAPAPAPAPAPVQTATS